MGDKVEGSSLDSEGSASFQPPETAHYSFFQRHKRWAIYSFLVIILFSVVFESIYLLRQGERSGRVKEVINIDTTISPSVKLVNDQFSFAFTEPDVWQKTEWKSFTFSYPKDFKITDGGFSESFFYLDVNGDPSKMIRIYGISEDWKSATVENIVSQRNKADNEGFVGFKLEEQKVLDNQAYARIYTWNLGGPPTYRTYEIIKMFGRDARFLRVTAPVFDWERNKSVLDALIQRIKY